MRLARIEGLPPEVKPVVLSASLARHVVGYQPLGSTSNLRPTGDMPTVQEAEADPRIVPHVSPPPDPPTDGERAEAMRKLGAAENLCRPADPRLIAFWCARLRDLPFAPEGQAAAQEAIAAICLACADLPGVVWTNETLALALRTFRRWPAPADVWLLLSGQAKPFLRTRDGLRRVVASAPTNPGTTIPKRRDPPTEAELAAVDGIMHAWRMEIGYGKSRPLEHEAAPEPKLLAPGVLLASYEKLAAQGDKAAKLRLEMLRRHVEPESKPPPGDTPRP